MTKTLRAKTYEDENGLMLRLRNWKASNLDGTLSEARDELRNTLTEYDINMMFDQWMNRNWNRVQLETQKDGTVRIKTVTHREVREQSADDRVKLRKITDTVATRAIKAIKVDLYQEFADRIWDTILPNGVTLHNATGKDMREAGGWYSAVADKMKSTEKVAKKFKTRELFNLSLRFDSTSKRRDTHAHRPSV